MEEKQIVSNVFAETEILDGVLYIRYTPNSTISLEGAKMVVRDRVNLCQRISYPIFIDGRKVSHITKEARNYFTKGDGIAYINACAFIVDTVWSVMFTNFFIKVSAKKVSFPIKTFKDKGKALKWLEQYK